MSHLSGERFFCQVRCLESFSVWVYLPVHTTLTLSCPRGFVLLSSKSHCQSGCCSVWSLNAYFTAEVRHLCFFRFSVHPLHFESSPESVVLKPLGPCPPLSMSGRGPGVCVFFIFRMILSAACFWKTTVLGQRFAENTSLSFPQLSRH